MKNELFKKGIIYCRVSSSEQVDGTSLESQQRMCEEYAKRENISILKIFIEKGESAKTANRTEFIKAVSFCSDKKNSVNYFIVYKLDRFARNQLDHVTVRESLRKYETELKSVTEPINESATGKLMEGILSSFAEFDNSVRTERSVGGMKERIKQGVWVWRAPAGYYRPTKGSNLVIDPITSPFIKTIFEEYSKGIYTFESLATFVSNQGFKTKNNKNPCPQLIEKIIRNPLYCGIIKVWEEEHQASFEPIISRELFEECQEGKKKKAHTCPRTSKNPHFSLRKLSVCNLCGKSLTASRCTGRHGIKYSYYHHQKQDCPNAKFIPKENFEQAFVEFLNTITPDEKYEKAFKAIVMDIWKTNYSKINENNARTRKELEKLEQDRQRIFDLHRSGVYSDDDFVAQKKIVNSKIDQKYRLINDKRIEEFDMEEALSYSFDFIRNTSSRWLNFEYQERVRFQKMIFEDNIEFNGEKFGTTKLSLVYKGNEEYQQEESKLVTLRGIEPRFGA
jgi:site-specific DNA recombinase